MALTSVSLPELMLIKGLTTLGSEPFLPAVPMNVAEMGPSEAVTSSCIPTDGSMGAVPHPTDTVGVGSEVVDEAVGWRAGDRLDRG